MTAGFVSTLLAPMSFAYDGLQQAKFRRTKPQSVGIPIICIGNPTLGGSGKTPFAIMLSKLLNGKTGKLAFLLRGYGGQTTAPTRVDPAVHSALEVGDEALLLASHEMTIVSADRVGGARLCKEHGAELIIMDDGYQNPSIAKDISILLLPPSASLGNAKVFPAGPLREPVERALERADFAIDLSTSDGADLPSDVATYRARLVAASQPPDGPCIAFCGIGRPAGFFTMLTENGCDLKDKIAFPDHHPFSMDELNSLKEKARKAKAILVTTTKDFARLPADWRENVAVFDVTMKIDAEEKFAKALQERLPNLNWEAMAP